MTELNAMRKPDADEETWLSALFDGELETETAKRHLAHLDPDAARRWADYSLIGDALRGCGGRRPDLTARIGAALADEPTVLAPMAAKHDTPRPYYLAAAAAAVAAIAWGVLSMSPQEGAGPIAPVAVNAPANAVTPATLASASNDEAQPYLAAHQDYAYAVAGEPEMRFTQVSLAGGER